MTPIGQYSPNLSLPLCSRTRGRTEDLHPGVITSLLPIGDKVHPWEPTSHLRVKVSLYIGARFNKRPLESSQYSEPYWTNNKQVGAPVSVQLYVDFYNIGVVMVSGGRGIALEADARVCRVVLPDCRQQQQSNWEGEFDQI